MARIMSTDATVLFRVRLEHFLADGSPHFATEYLGPFSTPGAAAAAITRETPNATWGGRKARFTVQYAVTSWQDGAEVTVEAEPTAAHSTPNYDLVDFALRRTIGNLDY